METKEKTHTIYGLIADNGDGSSSMHWFRTGAEVKVMLEKEYFFMNEGRPAETLTFPADLDLKAAGFTFNEDYGD